MDENTQKEVIHGYEVKRAITFENDRGFALAENPNAVDPFVTWQFTEEENGKRDYYWGHYCTNEDTAVNDYVLRVAEYAEKYGLSEKDAYKYYSTMRPVDIGTFPKTENGPIRFVNFDSREGVEDGRYQAWGYIVYDAPLTDKQINDYELKPAPNNPDMKSRMQDITQMNRTTAPKSIAEQLTEGAKQAAIDNAARSTPSTLTDKDSRQLTSGQLGPKWREVDFAVNTNTKKRKRGISIQFYVTEAEHETIQSRMEEVGTNNMSAFIRKQALNGYVLHVDLSPVQELVSLQRRCANNINQITVQANTYGGIYPQDIKTLQKDYDALWKPLPDLLKQLAAVVAIQLIKTGCMKF